MSKFLDQARYLRERKPPEYIPDCPDCGGWRGVPRAGCQYEQCKCESPPEVIPASIAGLTKKNPTPAPAVNREQ